MNVCRGVHHVSESMLNVDQGFLQAMGPMTVSEQDGPHASSPLLDCPRVFGYEVRHRSLQGTRSILVTHLSDDVIKTAQQ